MSSALRAGRKWAQTAAFLEGFADRAATAEKEEARRGICAELPHPPTHSRSCWDG